MSREHLGQFAIAGNMGFTRGILLLDDCEGTLGWTISGTGGDFAGAYATAAAWVGTNGLHLATKTTNPAQYDIVEAARVLEWQESGLVVFRLRFASPDVSDVRKITVKLGKDLEDDVYWAEVDFLPQSNEVKYRSGAAAWVDTGIDPGGVADLQWGTCEIVVDLTALKWVSLRMFGQYVDMSDIAMWEYAASGSVKAVLPHVVVDANAGAVAEGYFDQMYVGEHVDL